MMQCFPLHAHGGGGGGGMPSIGKKTNLAPGRDTDVTAVSPRQHGL